MVEASGLDPLYRGKKHLCVSHVLGLSSLGRYLACRKGEKIQAWYVGPRLSDLHKCLDLSTCCYQQEGKNPASMVVISSYCVPSICRIANLLREQAFAFTVKQFNLRNR